MDDIGLLIDLHRNAKRQGPGGNDETRLSIILSGLKDSQNLRIADIGCGTGASTLVLAEELDAEITAVDFLPDFLERLQFSAEQQGYDDRIETLACSMDSLPFDENAFDAIWSEGAIYNIGFESGVRDWRRYLKTGGILAVSELTWLASQRPAELEQHWTDQYPQVDSASAKMAILEVNGYIPIGYFPLRQHCWLDNYYGPMQQRFADFLSRHDHSEAARSLVEAEQKEIDLYKRYSDYFSYGYYVARKVVDNNSQERTS